MTAHTAGVATLAFSGAVPNELEAVFRRGEEWEAGVEHVLALRVQVRGGGVGCAWVKSGVGGWVGCAWVGGWGGGEWRWGRVAAVGMGGCGLPHPTPHPADAALRRGRRRRLQSFWT